MHFGAHCYLFVERWSDDCLHVLDSAAALGLDCFEIAVGDDVVFDPALTRRHAESLGLRLLVSPGGAWPADCDLSSDNPAERRRALAWHRRQVDLAGQLGALAYCGALYGRPGVVRRRRPPADEYDRIAEGLHALAEYGARNDTAIVLEPMSHFRTHLVNTPAQLMDLIGRAAHANLFALLDTYHLVTEVRDYAVAIHAARERLWAIHACENDRGVPGGGLVPWESVFGALRAIGFDGYVLFEAYNSSIGDFAFQRGMFHDVCPDGAAFVRDALAFVRGGLGRGSAEPSLNPEHAA
jgi:D-psicose/D-tagatose/L-ribulose 3-epimerase